MGFAIVKRVYTEINNYQSLHRLHSIKKHNHPIILPKHTRIGTKTDNIAAKFTNKELPTIEGETKYVAINGMVQELYGNALTLTTALGGVGGGGCMGISS